MSRWAVRHPIISNNSVGNLYTFLTFAMVGIKQPVDNIDF
jgi:hypothetical protein